MDTWFLIKKTEIHDGKKKAHSANGVVLSRCRYLDKCKEIQIYHNAQTTSLSQSKDLTIKPDIVNLTEEKVGTTLNTWSKETMS